MRHAWGAGRNEGSLPQYEHYCLTPKTKRYTDAQEYSPCRHVTSS